MLVYVLNAEGNIVYEKTYTNASQMSKDIEILSKPAAFGVEGFMICIKKI